MVIYDKKGGEINIPHRVDAKEWVASGDYFYDNPKAKKPTRKTTVKETTKK